MVIFGDGRRGEGAEGEPGDGGRWFIASEPVEKGGEDSQRAKDQGGVARVVVVADRHSEILEGDERVAVLGLEVGQTGRQE